MATIGLNIIAKDELDKILNLVSLYLKYFDKIYIAVDSEETFNKLPQSENIKVFHYKHNDELLDFAKKRNFLLEQSKTDYIFRLDTDDTIDNPESIKDIVKLMSENGTSVVTTWYEYSKDEWGNVSSAHYRETIIVNDGSVFWATNSGIHECILPKNINEFTMVSDSRLKILHHIDKEHARKSAERNIKYLIKSFNKDKEKTDPRTLGYLGRTFYGLGRIDEAIYFLEKHIEKSGWDDDRYLSWCQLGDLYLKHKEDLTRAKACAFEALQEKPEFPDAYFLLHDIFFNEDNWQKSLEWGRMGFEKEFPKTNLFVDPSSYTWRPMLSIAECYFQLGDYEKAKNLFDRAKSYVPELPYVKEYDKVYTLALEHQNYVKNFLGIVKFLKGKDKSLLRKLAESVPEELFQHNIIANIRDSALPAPVYGSKSVVILCSSTAEEWSPKSVAKGVGGSEEAVIHLSRELAKLGYEVEVFNNCGENEGIYDGVKYSNVVRFNPKGRFNILISWRLNIFDRKVQARKKIIWFHDVPSNVDWHDPDTINLVDKFVFLSKYHASLVPVELPKDKVFLSTNGINADDFLTESNVKREPHRIIYASSYDRGLEEILLDWHKVRKEVPDAELHVYYGWNTFDNFIKYGYIKDDGWKSKMLKLLNQEGVYEHGRIGHKELIEEYRKSGVYAYPCKYVGEIQCIALTKAIACGCKVITNDFAVMKERSPKAVSNKDFTSALIETLKSDEVGKVDQKFIEDNSWISVAKDWSANLFPIDIDTEIEHRIAWSLRKFTKDDKIVDIGSNKGHLFEGWDRSKITSVDIDEYDIPNFVRADATNLPFKDKEFDKAMLAEIVEHVPDAVAVWKEAHRVAKKVIATVPYEYEWSELYMPFNTIEKEAKRVQKSKKDLAYDGNPTAKDIYDKDGYKHLYHQRYYTPETLKADLEKAGIKNYKITKLRFEKWAWLGVEID